MINFSYNLRTTKAILIGISDYQFMQPMEPSLNNIKDLAKLLTDEKILGLPPKHIIKIVNKRNDEINDEINQFIHDPANASVETLIFYYVGHGIRSHIDKEIYLTGTNSKEATIKTSAIAYNDIKRQLENSHIQQRVMVIDACHSGLAAMGPNVMGDSFEWDIKGTYVLASAAGTEQAFFEKGKRNTMFSQELFNVMRNGLPVQRPYISLDEIFSYLLHRVKSSTPQRRSNLNVGDFFFLRNTGFKSISSEEEGDALLHRGKYKEAVIAFEKAYARHPFPELLSKINRCKEKLEEIKVSDPIDASEVPLRDKPSNGKMQRKPVADGQKITNSRNTAPKKTVVVSGNKMAVQQQAVEVNGFNQVTKAATDQSLTAKEYWIMAGFVVAVILAVWLLSVYVIGPLFDWGKKVVGKAPEVISSIKEEDDWKKAMGTNTTMAYQEYLKIHSFGIHALLARKRIVEIRSDSLFKVYRLLPGDHNAFYVSQNNKPCPVRVVLEASENRKDSVSKQTVYHRKYKITNVTANSCNIFVSMPKGIYHDCKDGLDNFTCKSFATKQIQLPAFSVGYVVFDEMLETWTGGCSGIVSRVVCGEAGNQWSVGNSR